MLCVMFEKRKSDWINGNFGVVFRVAQDNTTRANDNDSVTRGYGDARIDKVNYCGRRVTVVRFDRFEKAR